MATKGIRGAITVEENTASAIQEAVSELLKVMVSVNNIDIPNALEKCLRVLIVLNCEENFEPEFVYLKGASALRG